MSRICNVFSTSVSEIEQTGKACTDANDSDIVTGDFQLGGSTFVSWRYPDFHSKTWRKVDATMVRFSDEDSRYLRGAGNQSESCAYDCVMFAAMQVDIGRSSIEQLGPNGMALLPDHHKLARVILSGPLSGRQGGEYTRLIAVLREQLAFFDPKTFPLNRAASAITLVETLFKGSPTFSWHSVKFYGGGVAEASKNCKLSPVFSSFTWVCAHQATSFPNQLRNRFSPQIRDVDEGTASSQGRVLESTQTYKYRFVLDRLPPVLQVIVESQSPVTLADLKRLQAFDDVPITYRSPSSTIAVTYKVEGIIVLCQRHFEVYWRRPGEAVLSHYDGFGSGSARGLVKATEIRSFYDLPWDTGVQLQIIYLVVD